MVKTSPCNAGGVGSIPGRGAKIPHASLTKKKKKNQNINNRNNTVTNSVETLKMTHIQKSLKNKNQSTYFKQHLGMSFPTEADSQKPSSPLRVGHACSGLPSI